MPTPTLAEDSHRCAADRAHRTTGRGGKGLLWAQLASCLAAFGVAASSVHAASDVFERTIEELGELRVVSVSRRSEPLREAASSIYVITAEDIRRSGFSTIPEVLRLAPGVEVARNGAHSWTISVRGFNSDLSNKLLVLIDGRSVYSPLYAGVFWDAQDTLMQDIERIEVISGPGGTLWGANAVNGVINIITRSASETKGTLVEVSIGDEQQLTLGLRHGFSLSEHISARAYLKYTDRDASRFPSGEDSVDDVGMSRGGFRLDWDGGSSRRVTLQGDIYDAELGAMINGDFMLGTLPGPAKPGDIEISGHNLLARWNRQLASGGDVRLQAYYDHTTRNIPGSFNEDRDTLDLDFQHHFTAAERHNIVWGAGFRWTSDQLDNTLFASFVPDARMDRTYSVFFQDEIGLWDNRAFLTLGAKLENNDYTDFEFQPNIRATWNVADGHRLWAAVSRAVRVPARLNTDLELIAPVELPGLGIPLYILLAGNDDYESGELIATEAGYRAGLTQNLSLDFAFYYNQYDRLQTQEQGDVTFVGDPAPGYVTVGATLRNGMEGDTYGGTLVANWQPSAWWKLQFQYAYLEMDLELKPGVLDEYSAAVAGNSPAHQAAVHSFLELPYDFDLYAGIRYTDDLPALGIPDYTSVDLSLGWQATERFRTSLTVRNLNDDAHLEFGGGNLIERSVRLMTVFTF